MKRTPYFRFLALSVLWAAIFSAISLFGLIKFSGQAGNEHRKDFLLSLGSIIEQKAVDHAFDDLPFGRRGHFPPPPNAWEHGPPRGPNGPNGAPFSPPPFAGGPPDGMMPPPSGPGSMPHPSLWIINDKKEVLATNESETAPEFQSLTLPNQIHGIESFDSFFQLRPSLLILRMNTKAPSYLVLSDTHSPFRGPMFTTQLMFSFGAVLTAVFLSLVLTFLYLKHKSSEAKAVLLQLEKGNLKARFEIKRFDEFGSLMLDFNRMATEIEHLVSRVHETETARKNILQELGHDLKTPLTSIKTAFETLKKHFTKMTDEQRVELFDVVGAEVSYFQELLEKLITISSLDEPHYKTSTELVKLEQLLAHEVRARATGGDPTPIWEFASNITPDQPANLLGESNLILRLFKNALDNAGRFARGKVVVRLSTDAQFIYAEITDDGPGLTPEELEGFGKRRLTRMRPKKEGVGFSVGLGSVIMTAIVNLHSGEIHMENTKSAEGRSGACLKIKLPRVYSAPLFRSRISLMAK